MSVFLGTDVAEYVSPGHPDRLADAVVEGVVREALRRHPNALCAIEAAVHDREVFVDGRHAGNLRQGPLDVAAIVREAYRAAGYGRDWRPLPENLIVHDALCQEPLGGHEEEIRGISDDQSITIGHASPWPQTNHLPVAHWLAHRIGHALWEWRCTERPDLYGPDFKVLVRVEVDARAGVPSVVWRQLVLNVQHRAGLSGTRMLLELRDPVIKALFQAQAAGIRGALGTARVKDWILNGCGEFVQGGPEGDNGLSGKKLVVDHYGPSVPIGGGALVGKDPFKVDRSGALRSRQCAVALAKRLGGAVTVKLGWAPGERSPGWIEAESRDVFGLSRRIPDRELPDRSWFDLQTVRNELALAQVDWPAVLHNGTFTRSAFPWEKCASRPEPVVPGGILAS